MLFEDLIPPWAPEQKLQRLEEEQSAGAGSLRGSCWQPRSSREDSGSWDVMEKLLQTAETLISSHSLPNERQSLTSGTGASPEGTESHTALSELYSQWSSPA